MKRVSKDLMDCVKRNKNGADYIVYLDRLNSLRTKSLHKNMILVNIVERIKKKRRL